MTREEAFKEINETQDYYVNNLVELINKKNYNLKQIGFTSPTGTGKTNMMAKLINLMPDVYFIVTTLSKGQLQIQIKNKLKKLCNQNNYDVYGTYDYKINSRLQADDIISKIPLNFKCIWLRDEGHIKTNRFDALLESKCFKVINFSATNTITDIKCNFLHTMMLRTVQQNSGTPEDAILKLLEVKKVHKNIKKYNPCAIFRITDSNNNLEKNNNLIKKIINLCELYNLKYINIIDENNFSMQDLCRDDNENDVIINKFKIVEGIDIRRAHVIYMDNKPNSDITTIQVIGRARRNALLYRNDIDIFSTKNKKILEDTRKCYVYYNVESMNIRTDENGELEYAFCDTVSVEKIKPNTKISVTNGQLENGIKIEELSNQTGEFQVKIDKETGFNVVDNLKFYETENINSEIIIGIAKNERYLDFKHFARRYVQNIYAYKLSDLFKLNKFFAPRYKFNPLTMENERIESLEFIDLDEIKSVQIDLSKKEIVKMIDNSLNILDQCKNNSENKIRYNRNKVIKIELPKLLKLETEGVGNLIHKCNAFVIVEEKQFMSKERAIKELNSRINSTKNAIVKTYQPLSSLTYTYTDGKKIEPICKINKDKDLKSKLIKIVKVEQMSGCCIKCSEISNVTSYRPYTKTVNDRHSAIIGCDEFRQSKDDNNKILWIEDKTLTNKIKKYCKFSRYIDTYYEIYLSNVKEQLFNGKNNFGFNKKCNSCIGYCVEYYSKYLVYGKSYLGDFLIQAQKEARSNIVNEYIIVRACMLKYKELMTRCFTSYVTKLIPTLSAEKLLEESSDEFVKIVIELGTKTANFVKENLYPNQIPIDNVDPNLSIKHINGLADYITEDTILDIKATNYIDITMIKQVLGYHYLSTKRSDLHIKRLIVYDAVSGKYITINL